jgi:hypothetical protein
VHAAVKRGDGAAAGGPGAGTVAQLGEQGVEGLHGRRLCHASASEVTAVSRPPRPWGLSDEL